MEPVRGKHISFCDSNKTRETSLRSEQVVTIRIQRAVGNSITNRKKFSAIVKKKTEIHCLKNALGRFRNCRQSPDKRGSVRRGTFYGASKNVHARQSSRVGVLMCKSFAQRRKFGECSFKSVGRLN